LPRPGEPSLSLKHEIFWGLADSLESSFPPLLEVARLGGGFSEQLYQRQLELQRTQGR
jgi:hypothetical protein